jgi:hypothetical protein
MHIRNQRKQLPLGEVNVALRGLADPRLEWSLSD